MIDMSINPWQVLGVHRASTPDEVRHAYHTLMWKHHPDRGGSIEQAADITQCYKALTNPMLLKSYLDTLMVLGTNCMPCNGRGYSYKQRGITAKITTPCASCGGRGLLVKGGL